MAVLDNCNTNIPRGFDGYYLIDRKTGQTIRRKNFGCMKQSQKNPTLPLELHALILFVTTSACGTLEQIVYGDGSISIACDEQVACLLFGDCIPSDIGPQAAAMILAGKEFTFYDILDYVAKSVLESAPWMLVVFSVAKIKNKLQRTLTSQATDTSQGFPFLTPVVPSGPHKPSAPSGAPPDAPNRSRFFKIRNSFRKRYNSLFFPDSQMPKSGICFSSDATDPPPDFGEYIAAIRKAECDVTNVGEDLPARLHLLGATILWETDGEGCLFAFVLFIENADPPNLRVLAKWLEMLKAHEETMASRESRLARNSKNTLGKSR
eukprot:GEMP01029131.1.p1 GENE.GEMP01029131.1~~GEMP01029131.1.p1  ORF type:complete len:321 (+),score=51.26 GEMP01029131.1:165-1127(+)